MNRFLPVNQLKITSFSNCFEELSAAELIASVRPSVGVATSQDHREKVIPVLLGVLNDEFVHVFHLLGLVPAHLPWPHSL